ncbi:unnamed protein product [Lampetra planeri]
MKRVLSLTILICAVLCATAKTDGPISGRWRGGRRYAYAYSASVATGPEATGPGGRHVAGVSLDGRVHLAVLWSSKEQQLLSVTLSDVHFGNVSERAAKQDAARAAGGDGILGAAGMKALQAPTLVLITQNKVEGLYVEPGEPVVVENLKRGLVSLLQFQLSSGEATEIDVSGKCKVTYEVNSGQVTKVKDLKSCSNHQTAPSATNKVLGLKWSPKSVASYTFEGGFLKSVSLEETHGITLNMRTEVGKTVVSRQRLEMLSAEGGAKQLKAKTAKEAVASAGGKHASRPLPSEKLRHECASCPSAKKQLSAVRRHLHPETLSQTVTTRSFLKLVRAFRGAEYGELLRLLEDEPKDTLLQLIDAMSATQTDASLRALLRFLDLSQGSMAEAHERFLYACAFATKPSQQLLAGLLEKLKLPIAQSQTSDTLVIVIGALVGKLCQAGQCDSAPVVEARELLFAGLERAASDAEAQAFLLALKNTLLPDTVGLFARHAEVGSGASSVIAISGLQRFPDELITPEVRAALNRIYHQNRRVYEKTVRVAAMELILTKQPSLEEVRNILLSVGELPNEMSKFVVVRVNDLLHFHHPTSQVIRQVLRDPIVHNYDRFSKTGSSSAYSGFMSKTKDMTSTYSLNILYSNSGMLRKSNMNMFLFSHEAQLHSVQVSLEAQGLEGLIAATPDEGEEDLDSMAGMAPILFDVQLRPITFFHGYGDLMAKMWDATGEPTSAVKGIILLIDHSQDLSLPSGLRADVEFQGSLAIDISGSMDVSLWHRESKTIVRNKGALMLSGVVSVALGHLQVNSELSAEAAAGMDFTTTVKFNSYPFLVCMQMEKDTFPFREVLTQSEKVSGLKIQYSVRKGRSILIPGSEFPLHQDNSAMCRRMHQPKDSEPEWF